jgi:hypothetical protein
MMRLIKFPHRRLAGEHFQSDLRKMQMEDADWFRGSPLRLNTVLKPIATQAGSRL